MMKKILPMDFQASRLSRALLDAVEEEEGRSPAIASSAREEKPARPETRGVVRMVMVGLPDSWSASGGSVCPAPSNGSG